MLCLHYVAPLSARGVGPFHARRHRHKCIERYQRELSAAHRAVCEVKMGLEKENYETSIIMDEDEFNRSIEPILSKKDKVYAAIPDRDPNDINAHLKVNYCISVSAHRAPQVFTK